MINKLRLKLTVINSLSLVAILFVIGVFIYLTVNYDVVSTTDNSLISDAGQLKRFVSYVDGSLDDSKQLELKDEYSGFNEKVDLSLTAYQILDGDINTIIYKSKFETDLKMLYNIGKLPFMADSQAQRIIKFSDGTYYLHAVNSDGMDYRVCTTITSNEVGEMRIIQTIANLAEKNRYLDGLLIAILLSCIIGIILSFILSYIIANRSIKPIQENIKLQKEFIADASHELRTPLSVIRTNLDLVKLSGEESVDSQMEWIDAAYDETKRMENLIKGLLTLAKADLNQTVLNNEVIELNKLCSKVISMFEPVARQKEIELLFNGSDVLVNVIADRQKLSQLLLIVLENACVYSRANSLVRITISKHKEKAQIQIEDKGIGIESDELELIFNRFYRSDKARSRSEGGTGLGLAIAKNITLSFGGEIFAESEKGVGTIITIRLPIEEGI